jgi:hypothetical protein
MEAKEVFETLELRLQEGATGAISALGGTVTTAAVNVSVLRTS